MFKNSVVAGFAMAYDGRELVTAVNNRGWNLYGSTDLQPSGTFDADDMSTCFLITPAFRLESTLSIQKTSASQTPYFSVERHIVFLIIRSGPVNSLVISRRYVLMPSAQQPLYPRSVFGALERVAVALSRQTPMIFIDGARHSLTGFRIVSKERVKINAPEGHVISYPEAVAVAQTLFNTNTMEYD